jgi:CheY-like chemotaxis protein
MTPKILIVDDEILTQLLYKRHIEHAGYKVLCAKDGSEAVELAARESPRLIIMDIIMKEMDGLAALRALKKNDATKAIPVVIITASVSSHYATRRESEVSGAAGFLTKPLSPAQLLSEIQRLAPISPVD